MKPVLPRLFVASSKESLKYAYAIQKNLEEDAEVTVWSQGVFKLTQTSVESLINVLDKADFAIFVFAPDDALRLRKKTYAGVRDKVVFELGLFMGKLGSRRIFIVVPRGFQSLRIPTDLTGITLGQFNPHRKDDNLQAAFGLFCSDVRSYFPPSVRRRPPKKQLTKRPAILSKSDLIVLKAGYGARDHRFDVAKQLNAGIKDDKLHIYVGNQLAGDPCPNTPKDIVVTYRYKNQELTKRAQEGTDLDLP